MISQPVQNGHASDDGLQLANSHCEDEKYPGRLHDDPLYTINKDHEGLQASSNDPLYPLYVDHQGLQVSKEPHTIGDGRASEGFEANQRSQKQAVQPRKKLIYIVSIAISLIIIAAIVGGVVGSRKVQATHNRYGSNLRFD